MLAILAIISCTVLFNAMKNAISKNTYIIKELLKLHILEVIIHKCLLIAFKLWFIYFNFKMSTYLNICIHYLIYIYIYIYIYIL